MNFDWKRYYEDVGDLKPRPHLVEALGFVLAKGKALDIGAGSLRDSKFMLTKGFQNVDAVDPSDASQDLAKKIMDSKFIFSKLGSQDFDYGEGKYDLVNASYSLPFIGKEKFPETWEKIVKGIKPRGIFCGQLFGEKDSWNVDGDPRVFHTKTDLENLFKDFKIIKLDEEENDNKTASGDTKHWHVFHFILRKNEPFI